MNEQRDAAAKKGPAKKNGGADPRRGRRAGRTLAFQVLYGLDFAPEAATSLESLADNSPALFKEISPSARAFCLELVAGVLGRLAEIDALITEHSRRWKIKRIGKIELAILRLALYEIVFRADIPLKVSINEAVELAKRFGDEHSKAFVNGILDAAARSADPDRAGAAATTTREQGKPCS
jgi:N utilization substance protein B